MKVNKLLPRRPYLLRAFYEWLLDNNLTPHLLVDVTIDRVILPIEVTRNGQIVLNVTPQAVANLSLENDKVRFDASFCGLQRQVIVPMRAILAIYASENGAGIMFEPETGYHHNADMSVIRNNRADDYSDNPVTTHTNQPSLRLVK